MGVPPWRFKSSSGHEEGQHFLVLSFFISLQNTKRVAEAGSSTGSPSPPAPSNRITAATWPLKRVHPRSLPSPFIGARDARSCNTTRSCTDPATWCAVDSPPTELSSEERSFTREPSCTTSPTPSIPGRSTTRRTSTPTIEQLHFFSGQIEKPPAFGLNSLPDEGTNLDFIPPGFHSAPRRLPGRRIAQKRPSRGFRIAG